MGHDTCLTIPHSECMGGDKGPLSNLPICGGVFILSDFYKRL